MIGNRFICRSATRFSRLQAKLENICRLRSNRIDVNASLHWGLYLIRGGTDECSEHQVLLQCVDEHLDLSALLASCSKGVGHGSVAVG